VRVASLVLLTACWSSSSPPPPPEPIKNVAPRGPAEREPLPAHTVWRGFYECAQGKTALQLTLDLDTDSTVSAIFDFGPHPDNVAVPPGSYRLTGRWGEDGARLVVDLVPDRWINQPPNYEMVGLSAATGSRRQRMRGQISNPSCGALDVQRVR